MIFAVSWRLRRGQSGVCFFGDFDGEKMRWDPSWYPTQEDTLHKTHQVEDPPPFLRKLEAHQFRAKTSSPMMKLPHSAILDFGLGIRVVCPDSSLTLNVNPPKSKLSTEKKHIRGPETERHVFWS